MVDFAHADNTELLELLNILCDNGTITQEQFDKLKRASEGKKQEEREGDIDVKVTTKGGLEIATYDGNFSFELGGRLMIDAGSYDKDKNELGNGTELRRARLDLDGTIFADWGYAFGVDFAGGDADVKNAYVSYDGFWPTQIIVGQFKEPFSMEELSSSKNITFMERALPNEFAPGHHIGIGIDMPRETWTAALGLFGEAFGDDVDDEGNEGWAATGRVTFASIHSDTRALHLGAAASYRKTDSERVVKFNARPESHLTDIKYVDTGKIKYVDGLIKYGLEAAGVFGPLSLQGEYILTEANRRNGFQDAEFRGWYLQGSWFITGESRPYKIDKGVFGQVEPRNKYGAVEVAVRYSTIDLTDDLIMGGEEENITLGLNWYINPQIRLMANYIMVENDEDANADGDAIGDDDPNAFQFRFQLAF